MTCIVGLAVNGRVWMGGDSAGVAGMDLMIRADEKVFNVGRQRDQLVLGFTSSFRMGQLLQFGLDEVMPPDDSKLLFRWMVEDFVKKVRQLLANGGYRKKEHEVEKGGTFLIGVRGQLFRVEDDFQVAECWYNFDAVGCGGSVALGAMHASRPTGDPQRRVHQALLAAEAFSAGVRRPFVIKSTSARPSA